MTEKSHKDEWGWSRIEHWDMVFYPKPFVDWLCSHTRNMWSNTDKAYDFWVSNVRDKKKKNPKIDLNDIGTDWNNGEFYKD